MATAQSRLFYDHPDSLNDFPEVLVREASDNDARRAAVLHCELISEGFLSSFGPGFVSRLYRRIIRFPDSFLLVAERSGRVEAFIAGATDVGALYRSFLWHDGIPGAIQAAGKLLRSPRHVLETLRHPSAGGSGRGAELLSIAVDPGSQGHGLGRAMVESFLEELARRNIAAAHVVVGAQNLAAVSLYERCGFSEQERFELHAGTISLLMQWEQLGTAAAGTGPT